MEEEDDDGEGGILGANRTAAACRVLITPFVPSSLLSTFVVSHVLCSNKLPLVGLDPLSSPPFDREQPSAKPSYHNIYIYYFFYILKLMGGRCPPASPAHYIPGPGSVLTVRPQAAESGFEGLMVVEHDPVQPRELSKSSPHLPLCHMQPSLTPYRA